MLFSRRVVVGVLVATCAIAGVNARLQAHVHQHRGIAARNLHKSPASSGSTTGDVTGNIESTLPPTTGTNSGTGCSKQNCTLLDTTQNPGDRLHIPPEPQLQAVVQQYPTATSASRRQHTFFTRSLKDGPATLTPAAIDLLAKPSAGVEEVLTEPSQEDDKIHVQKLKARSDFHSNIVAPRQDDSYQSFVLGGFSSPTSTISAPSASASSICPSGNGTAYVSDANIEYDLICNIDFVDDNLQFQLVDSFAGCVQKCDAWNYNYQQVQCLAALFVSSREADLNDCYLKSSLAAPTAAALQITGAIRIGSATASSPSATTVSSTTSGTTSSTSASPASSTSTSSASGPAVTYASGNSVIPPKVAGSNLQGPSQNTPTKQYLDIEEPAVISLATDLLKVGVDGDLSTSYSMSPSTGALEVNSSTESYLSPLESTPHLSRDGGRGGMINGQHLFLFCDTGSYSTPTSTSNGNFLGFVSSSVAIDVGMNGLNGNALNLQDGIGLWSDNVGRMRGLAPLTDGEMAYNLAMQGGGQRYAVWPESSTIPLNSTTGLIYAPIVYDNVNMATKAAVFTYTGAALLTITAGGTGGPVAQRTVDKLFNQDEVEWGCAGGIRSWGDSGIGGDDGTVYVFGTLTGGVLLGRVSPGNIENRNAYEYWNGNSWSTDMQSSSSNAFFIEGSFMDYDVFYSPRHLTFIIMYLTSYADSTFYYRYLVADQGILPSFVPGGDSSSDYVENILKYKWSDQQVLYKAATGLSGKYIYSGGVHLGYYGPNDISNGGSKMLLSWTAPTGQDPSTLVSEYQIITAEVDWE